MGPINQEKGKFWLAQMALAEGHDGSLESFCRSRGLSKHTFAYWRRKFKGRGGVSRAVVPAKFVPVEIAKPEPAVRLPDARWLAEFISHLSGACQ